MDRKHFVSVSSVVGPGWKYDSIPYGLNFNGDIKKETFWSKMALTPLMFIQIMITSTPYKYRYLPYHGNSFLMCATPLSSRYPLSLSQCCGFVYSIYGPGSSTLTIYGFGSRRANNIRIQLDLDPQHWSPYTYQISCAAWCKKLTSCHLYLGMMPNNFSVSINFTFSMRKWHNITFEFRKQKQIKKRIYSTS